MADNIFDVLTSSEQIASNYAKYADKFKNSNDELVNSETFLNLLVAEMTNQDPLEPTSNTEFITQLAQMTQLQYMQDSSKYSM
ncbi:MAG: flagellar hook capping FlgD N-terminal domain-containing protein, partial [Oscillospiraceae bacterium]